MIMYTKARLHRLAVVICSALSLLSTPYSHAANPTKFSQRLCQDSLVTNLDRFGTAWEEVQIVSVASALVLRHQDLGRGMTEFLRMQLRSLKGDHWELAVYTGTERDRATVSKRVQRWSWDPHIFGMIDVAPELFLGARRLTYLADKIATTHPHIAKLIRDHARFALLRLPIPNTTRLELAQQFSSFTAYMNAYHKLEDIQAELARRHLTSDNPQFIVAEDGELFLINPEILRQGSKEELNRSLESTWEKIRALHP